MAQARAWCFTLNNPAYTHDLPIHPLERFVVWQLEMGEEGTCHLQGYIELTRQCRLAAMVAWLPGSHMETRRGTAQQATEYCEKEDSRVDPELVGVDTGPWRRGDPSRGGSGKRNDLADAIATMKTDGMEAVAREHPAVYVRNFRGLLALQEALIPRPTDVTFTPRPWQTRILSMLSAPANDRNVIYIFDKAGASGKSRLARHLMAEHNAVKLSGGVRDMAYVYKREPIVIIDIPRVCAENVRHLYQFAEDLKNGSCNSNKYESCVKHFAPPHVIFFSNEPCNTEYWTIDRAIIVDLALPRWHSPHFLPNLGAAVNPAQAAAPAIADHDMEAQAPDQGGAYGLDTQPAEDPLDFI